VKNVFPDTSVQMFGVMVNVFEGRLLCSSILHLFKRVTTVLLLQLNITILIYFKMQYIHVIFQQSLLSSVLCILIFWWIFSTWF